MPRPPDPTSQMVSAWLSQHYGLDLTRLDPLNLGLDRAASVYRLQTAGGVPYFLKVRSDPVHPASLVVPQLLCRMGIPNIIAPVVSGAGHLWEPLGPDSAVLSPFVEGESAVRAGLTPAQWTAFGRTLRAVHDPGVARQLAGQVPLETFELPSLGKVMDVEQALKTHGLEHPAQRALAVVWAEQKATIHGAGQRARRLGQQLQAATFESVLCHSDLHAANIMVSGERLFLVDWDSPVLAPPERDLLFVVESPIARRVLPEEETQFFAGYGKQSVNREVLTYFRYERAIQDIGEFGSSLLFDTGRSDSDMWLDLRLFTSLFAPGDILDLATRQDPGR